MASGGLWRYRTERYDPLVPAPLPTLSIDTTLLKPGLRVAVGLSGGADSVALLRILAERSRELGLVLHAAHLHHGLRGAEADADRDFCRELAQRLGLLFHETQVDTAAAALADAGTGKSAETIEEAARRLRYGWFRELMASGVVDAVATAHTLDDQAETVLARFLRGAWTEGLSGIYPVVQFPEGPHSSPPACDHPKRDRGLSGRDWPELAGRLFQSSSHVHPQPDPARTAAPVGGLESAPAGAPGADGRAGTGRGSVVGGRAGAAGSADRFAGPAGARGRTGRRGWPRDRSGAAGGVASRAAAADPAPCRGAIGDLAGLRIDRVAAQAGAGGAGGAKMRAGPGSAGRANPSRTAADRGERGGFS